MGTKVGVSCQLSVVGRKKIVGYQEVFPKKEKSQGKFPRDSFDLLPKTENYAFTSSTVNS